MDNPAIYIPIIGVAFVALYLLSCIRILNEYERGVVFRLGRVLQKPKGRLGQMRGRRLATVATEHCGERVTR